MSEYQRPRGLGGFTMFPPVIKTIIIINVCVFILEKVFLELSVGGVSLREYFIKYFYLFPIEGKYDFFRVWQLITYQFIHADIWHIFFNLFL